MQNADIYLPWVESQKHFCDEHNRVSLSSAQIIIVDVTKNLAMMQNLL